MKTEITFASDGYENENIGLLRATTKPLNGREQRIVAREFRATCGKCTTQNACQPKLLRTGDGKSIVTGFLIGGLFCKLSLQDNSS